MGQKFAAYDSVGSITGFYDSEDSPIPADIASFIEITDAQWLACISTPGYSVMNGVLVAPTALNDAQLLAAAQSDQINSLTAAYQTATQMPVNLISKNGANKTYQADANAVANLQTMLLAFQSTQAVPTGFYWVAADNSQVPFSYADMQTMAGVIGLQITAAFQQLQTLKARVNTASTIDEVRAVLWS